MLSSLLGAAQAKRYRITKGMSNNSQEILLSMRIKMNSLQFGKGSGRHVLINLE